MAVRAHDLSWDELERWVRELGYVNGKFTDWAAFREAAEIGTEAAMLKKRWDNGVSAKMKKKIRDTLDRLEKKKNARTSTGTTLSNLEEWNRIGVALSQDTTIFDEELVRLRARAAAVTKLSEARRAVAEAELDVSLSSITPEPKGRRK